jgi:succinate-semialdehyde dehydrogenase/glutarate-semialdehyde dehydrogenase
MLARTTRILKQKTWMQSWSGLATATFDVMNPATGTIISSVPDMGPDQAEEMIELAESVRPVMAALSADQRSRALLTAAGVLEDRIHEIAGVMSAEAGKSPTESVGEINYSVSLLRWFASESPRMYGRTIPTDKPGRRLQTILQPVGVASLITPWNFPIAMLARKLGAAIAAGCPVVMKPAEDTPLSAQLLQEAFTGTDVPHGAINLVTCSRGNVDGVGTALATSEAVRKVSFTGSTAVGLHLNELAARSAKRVSLELGGNAPLIVFDDADVGAAVEGTMQSRFRNSGQTCVCTNRVYVADAVYDRYMEQLQEAVSNMHIGAEADCENASSAPIQGPLINERAATRAQALLQSALDDGARVLVGGRGRVSGSVARRVGEAPARHGLDSESGKARTAGASSAPFEPGTSYFDPVLLGGVSQDMRVMQEESFAPILPVMRFSGEEAEAVELANHASAGLAAYAFTRDLGRAHRVSEALQYGMVGVNEAVISTAVAPFGGIKLSGLGREGGAEGIAEYCNVKYTAFGI